MDFDIMTPQKLAELQRAASEPCAPSRTRTGVARGATIIQGCISYPGDTQPSDLLSGHKRAVAKPLMLDNEAQQTGGARITGDQARNDTPASKNLPKSNLF